MALRDKVPLSIVDLNADCLFEIFSYLKLSDVVNFRSQCSFLNDAALEYLFSTTKVSILYTENEDPDEYLDETLEVCPQNFHFRSRDFIVVSGWQKYANFLRFVKKYFSNIKKLALIIDPDPTVYAVLLPVTKLLKACPRVETLFLERTSRGMNEWSTKHNWTFKVDDLGRLLITIAGLASLSKLHFFAYRTSSINLAGLTATMEDTFQNLAETMIGHFLLAMFNRLRIFHINNFLCQRVHRFWPAHYLNPLLGRTFENILEFGFETKDCKQLTNCGTVFEKLHTLTIMGYECGHFDEYRIGNSYQQLRTLHFPRMLRLTKAVMHNLNALPNLERITAEVVLHDEEVYENINKTIKHIQVKRMGIIRVRWEVIGNFVFTDFFQGLLTVTVLKPEVVVYKRNSFNDINLRLRRYW